MKCFLGSKANISYLMEKLNGYIYIDKGYHLGVSENLYKIIKKNNGIVVSLDEEGAVDFPDASTLKNRYSKTLFETAAKIFLWGNYQYSIVRDIVEDVNKIFVTGHPRFELLKSGFQSIYLEECDIIKKKHGQFILINTNFGFGNDINGDKFVFTNYGPRFKNIEDIVRFDKVKRDLYISLVQELVSSCKMNIIFRPHPEENRFIYEKAFAKYNSVDIINEGSVVPWLLSAEIMIHTDCTTAIESLMIGKKAISYLPKNFNPAIVTKLPRDVSFCIDSFQVLAEFINGKRYKINSSEEQDYQIIENNFSFSMDTTKVIVDEIINLGKLINKADLKYSDVFKLKILTLKKFIKKHAKISITPSLSESKLAGLNYTNINSIHNRLLKQRNNYNNHNIGIKKL